MHSGGSAGEEERTAAPNQEGYQEPRPGAEHLPEVQSRGQAEDGDEDRCGGQGGGVVVELEGVEAAAGLAGEECVIHLDVGGSSGSLEEAGCSIESPRLLTRSVRIEAPESEYCCSELLFDGSFVERHGSALRRGRVVRKRRE